MLPSLVINDNIRTNFPSICDLFKSKVEIHRFNLLDYMNHKIVNVYSIEIQICHVCRELMVLSSLLTIQKICILHVYDKKWLI